MEWNVVRACLQHLYVLLREVYMYHVINKSVRTYPIYLYVAILLTPRGKIQYFHSSHQSIQAHFPPRLPWQ